MYARHFRITIYGHCNKKDDKKITSDRIQETLMDEFTESTWSPMTNSLAPRFSRHLYIQDGEIIPEPAEIMHARRRLAEMGAIPGSIYSGMVPARKTGKRMEKSPMSANNPAALQPVIQLQKVVKTFKNAAGEFKVLKGVNLTLHQGEFVAIVGKSGSGKSTLLNMITGIDHPTSGQVIIGGTNIYQMSESKRSLWRGRNLGIVFQFFQLMPMLTLLENVMLPMDYVDMYEFDERPKRAMDLLAMVGLEKQAHKLPAAVSTGQQQSAAIARALATDPPIIAADEPTGNLDSRSADAVIGLFDQLVRERENNRHGHARSFPDRPHLPHHHHFGRRIDQRGRRPFPAALDPCSNAGSYPPIAAFHLSSRPNHRPAGPAHRPFLYGRKRRGGSGPLQPQARSNRCPPGAGGILRRD